MGVEPQEREEGSHHDEAEYGDVRISLQEGDDAVGDEGHGGRAAGQAVQTVRQIDGVAEADNEKNGDRHGEPTHVDQRGNAGNPHRVDGGGTVIQNQGNDGGQDELHQALHLGRDAALLF